MPPLGPISRRELIAALRRAGFEGPFTGAKHQVMEGRGERIHVPNPHQSDIGVQLLVRILRQAGISRQEWEQL